MSTLIVRAYHELFAMKRKFSGGVKGERYTNRNCSFSKLKNTLSGNPVISFDDILLKIEKKTVFIVFLSRGQKPKNKQVYIFFYFILFI